MLGYPLAIPAALAERAPMALLSKEIAPDYSTLRHYLFSYKTKELIVSYVR